MVERISAAPTGVPPPAPASSRAPASRAPAASSKKEKKAKAKELAARKGGKTTQRTHTKKKQLCIDEVELRLNATQQTDGVGERTEEVLLALQLEGPDAVRELTRLLGLYATHTP